MAQALAVLAPIRDKNVLVGVNTADDAGVYKLTDDLALVYTVDVLTPIIDEPFVFGQIVATNCISDVYAMGGDPKIALNIVGFPANGDPKMLGEILRGGQTVADQAGVTTIGGHTFNTPNIKYGLSVIGYIHPEKIFTNAGARPGDVILLTKPLGVGTLIQSHLLGKSTAQDLRQAIEAMTTLNRDASHAMRNAGAHAATDITGYGLAGHLVEMAEASSVGIELSISRIPFYKEALDILESGIMEPGIMMNMNSFGNRVDKQGVDDNRTTLIFGAETSGGLAVVLPEDNVHLFRKHYKPTVSIIGRVTSNNKGRVTLTQ